jgi:hypothetical protein
VSIDNEVVPSERTREIVQRAFPGAVLAQDYIAWTLRVCAQYGMTPEHTMPILVTCRDEVITDYKALVSNAWGLTFSGDSLGGAFTMGRTGLDAARRHVPEAELPVRVAFFVFPHIGIDAGGEIGNIRRQGRLHTSRACGAIITMHDQFLSGQVRLEFDPTDPEMSLLRQRIAPKMLGRDVPDLVTMTTLVRDAALEDLIATGITTGGPVGDLAIFSGLVVNGPEESTWVWSDIASFRRHDTSSIFDLHATDLSDS